MHFLYLYRKYFCILLAFPWCKKSSTFLGIVLNNSDGPSRMRLNWHLIPWFTISSSTTYLGMQYSTDSRVTINCCDCDFTIELIIQDNNYWCITMQSTRQHQIPSPSLVPRLLYKAVDILHYCYTKSWSGEVLTHFIPVASECWGTNKIWGTCLW